MCLSPSQESETAGPLLRQPEYTLAVDRVSSLIGKVLRKRGLHEHAQSAHLIHEAKQWIESSAPGLVRSTDMKYLKNGILTVQCHHAIASQEMQALSRDLLSHLQKTFGETAVVQIRVERS